MIAVNLVDSEKENAWQHMNILQLAARSVCQNTTLKTKLSIIFISSAGTSTNPMDVIRATDASSVMVKDLGPVQMLGCANWMNSHWSFLKNIKWNKHSPERIDRFLRNELKWNVLKEVKLDAAWKSSVKCLIGVLTNIM